uniref:FERM domain-containing protein n=1 Tax=Ascaris lumbricoides TaxID=6252 RepID=A0A0M3I0D2_ASCLU
LSSNRKSVFLGYFYGDRVFQNNEELSLTLYYSLGVHEIGWPEAAKCDLVRQRLQKAMSQVTWELHPRSSEKQEIVNDASKATAAMDREVKNLPIL